MPEGIPEETWPPSPAPSVVTPLSCTPVPCMVSTLILTTNTARCPHTCFLGGFPRSGILGLVLATPDGWISADAEAEVQKCWEQGSVGAHTGVPHLKGKTLCFFPSSHLERETETQSSHSLPSANQ